MTDRSRFAEYRDRLRGGPPRVLQPCGTVAAARRHEKAGESKCPACAAAWRTHQAEMYRRRRRLLQGATVGGMATHPGPCLNHAGQNPGSEAWEQMSSDLKSIIRVMHERIQRGGPTNYLDGNWYLTDDQRAIVRHILAS